MRLLRAGPDRHFTIFDFNEGASRTHGGVRLEWPFIFGLNDPRRSLEGFFHVTVLFFDLPLAHGSVAHVLVERGLLREWWLHIGPGDLKFLCRLDRAPFFLSDYAQE